MRGYAETFWWNDKYNIVHKAYTIIVLSKVVFVAVTFEN